MSALDAGEQSLSLDEREELAYKLLASLPRTRLVHIHRRIAPFLQLDIVGLLPDELSIQIFSFLPYPSLITCARVSRRWYCLATEQALWKGLCQLRGWAWKDAAVCPPLRNNSSAPYRSHPQDDEGVGDDEFEDSGIASFSVRSLTHSLPSSPRGFRPPSVLRQNLSQLPAERVGKPDYMLLYQTRMVLRRRLLNGDAHLTSLQTRETRDGQPSTTYCLQLFTMLDGRQVLFTGSRDTAIRQWDLSAGIVQRVLAGVHVGSVLSLYAQGRFLASAGGDSLVVLWEIATGRIVKTINDHTDSALCVRFDEERLVSCGKDHTVRSYLFPSLELHLVLASHRAAVNAVALAPGQIISASGDRSICVWCSETGALLHRFEGHHARGIASIDVSAPFVLSGSSDKHVRLFDITNPLRGWSTCPSLDPRAKQSMVQSPTCEACGGELGSKKARKRSSTQQCVHRELVRTVALTDDFALSGSYDQTVKVWDRKSGALIADLLGGHSRILCIDSDCTKIVSCGEDDKICIFNFAHGINTAFVKL